MRSAPLLAVAALLAGCATPNPPADGDTPPGGDDMDGMDDDMDHDVPPLPDDDTITNADATPWGNHQVTTTPVDYTEGRTGHFARPRGNGTWPGIVVIHEWWGLNDQIRNVTEILASHGYAALAVDLFGTVATTQDQALAQIRAYNATEGVADLRDAATWLREDANATGVASLGWCFGGGQSLELALSGEELYATVIYYGTPVNDTSRLAAIDGPVLGHFGEEDTSIPVARVLEFETALDEAGVENEIHLYPDVGHAFANPSGGNYAPEPTRVAWERTLALLAAEAPAGG